MSVAMIPTTSLVAVFGLGVRLQHCGVVYVAMDSRCGRQDACRHRRRHRRRLPSMVGPGLGPDADIALLRVGRGKTTPRPVAKCLVYILDESNN